MRNQPKKKNTTIVVIWGKSSSHGETGSSKSSRTRFDWCCEQNWKRDKIFINPCSFSKYVQPSLTTDGYDGKEQILVDHLSKISFDCLQVLSILKGSLESVEQLNRIWMPNLKFLWISIFFHIQLNAKFLHSVPSRNVFSSTLSSNKSH